MAMAMKKQLLLVVVAINLVALLALAVYLPELMVSPGKLIDAHAELTDDCFACHTPLLGSRPQKCIACHAVAEIGLVTTGGVPIDRERKNVAFHQELLEDDCVACHADHRGVQAFRPIGQFSHALLAAATRDRCDGCHSGPDDALHRRIEGNCAQCHTQEAWLPATFDHDDYFRFDRDHDTDCVTCHLGNDYASYTCYGCHEHSRSKIREEHLEEGIRDYEQCVDCHRSGDEDEAKRIWRSRASLAPDRSGRERDRDNHD
jgi:hypothetical protein